MEPGSRRSAAGLCAGHRPLILIRWLILLQGLIRVQIQIQLLLNQIPNLQLFLLLILIQLLGLFLLRLKSQVLLRRIPIDSALLQQLFDAHLECVHAVHAGALFHQFFECGVALRALDAFAYAAGAD